MLHLPLAFEAVLNLQMTSGIRGRDHGCSGPDDTGDLFLLQLRRLLGLGNVVNSRAAAAVGRIREFDQFEVRDRPQYLPRLK